MTDATLPEGPSGPRVGESEWSIIRRAVTVQIRVLFALFLREAGMRRGRSVTLGWAAAGLEPLIIVGAITLAFSLINRHPAYGSNMLLFVGTGVFPIYTFIHTSMRVREPLGIAHLGRYPIEMPLDEVLVHAVLHFVANASIAVLYFSALYISGIRDAMPYDLGSAIMAFVAIFLLGVAMGIFNSVVGRIFPFWNTLWPGIARASLHFSAIYYVADYLSPNVRKYFALNPVLHGVNWFRHSFYPFYPNVINNHRFVLMTSLIAVSIGLCLERTLRREVFHGEHNL